MSTQFRITIPGEPWTNTSKDVQDEIQSTNTQGDNFPITRIFDYIALTDSNRDLEQKIKQRGAFERQSDGVYLNRGVPISRAIHDIHQDIGRVAIYFPREVGVALSQNLVVAVDQERRRRVVLSFRDKPPTAGFGRRFTLHRVVFAEDGVSYDFVDQSDDSRILTLFVDFNEEPQQLQTMSYAAFSASGLLPLSATKSAQTASIVSNAAFTDGACVCCTPFEPVKPCYDPGGNLIVRIHAKILEIPFVNIATQVAAVNTVYGSEIECVLDSTEILDPGALGIPHLVDYDAGECTSTTDPGRLGELQEISQFRDNADALDIVVYYVRTIVSGGGFLAGCASSLPGRPTCVMARSTSQWVLAHEIGHVLDLVHVPNDPSFNHRLMFPSDSFVGTPQIVADELRTMRCSRFTVNAP